MNKESLTNRRQTLQHPESELYKLKDIDKFIETERRSDELDRIGEIQMQKRIWLKTMLLSGLVNLVFIVFGIVGLLYGK